MTASKDESAGEAEAGLRVDLLVIGFGKGGKTLAGALGRRGQRVVLVEQSDRMYGGTCINIGCVPTKALLHHSEERRGTDDPAAWFEKSAGEVHELTAFLNQKNFAMLDTVVTGKARFVSPTTVEVRAGDDRLLVSADAIVVNTGAVPVDEHLRSSRPHIYAVGDVNGGPQFTYISLDDNRIVADQLVGSGTRSTADRRAVPTTTFVTPPLSTVGMTERAARAAGHRVKVAAKPVAQIAAMPRARIVGETRGLVKFVVDADTDLVLGAALLAIDSQETINTVALAIRHGVTATELRDTIYTHPSATEAFNEVLASFAD